VVNDWGMMIKLGNLKSSLYRVFQITYVLLMCPVCCEIIHSLIESTLDVGTLKKDDCRLN
jgi:hypothetical protein